jgi:MFS family permease
MNAAGLPLARLSAFGGALFLLSYLLRSSFGPIEPGLEREFGFGATQAGLLAGALFAGFAVAQIPLGMLIDRRGARPVLLAAGIVLALAAAAFARAESFAALLAARFAMGVASAPLYAGLMALAAPLAAPGRFAAVAGIESGIGRAGLVLAAGPLAMMYAALGWRTTFDALAAALAAATAALAWALRGPANRGPTVDEPAAATRAGLRTTLRTPGLAALVLFQGVAGTLAYVLLASFGTAWLASVQQLGPAQAAWPLTACAVAYALAAPLWGALARDAAADRRLTLGVGLALAALMALAAAAPPTGARLWLWLAAVGLGSGCYPLLLAQVKRRLPAPLMVRGLTVLGVGSMAVGFALLAASGALIDHVGDGRAPGMHPPAAFTALFAALAAVMLAATSVYAWCARPQSSPGSSEARVASSER